MFTKYWQAADIRLPANADSLWVKCNNISIRSCQPSWRMSAYLESMIVKQAISWANVDPVLGCNMVSSGALSSHHSLVYMGNELRLNSITFFNVAKEISTDLPTLWRLTHWGLNKMANISGSTSMSAVLKKAVKLNHSLTHSLLEAFSCYILIQIDLSLYLIFLTDNESLYNDLYWVINKILNMFPLEKQASSLNQ